VATGRVKWFNDFRGYGLIECDDGSEDVFVHYTGIAGDGYHRLKEGARVEFNVTPDPKGPRANQVALIAD